MLAVVILPFATPVRATTQSGSAETAVRNLVASMKSLTEATTPTERAAIFATVNRSLAIERLARESLGPEWDKLSRDQQRRFVTLFTQALEKLAYPRVSRALEKIGITYLGEQAKHPDTLVRTKVTRPDGGAISVNYTLENQHRRWMVVDVSLDGESLAKAVHTRIQRALAEKGYKGLVADLEQHVKGPQPVAAENRDTASPGAEPDATTQSGWPSQAGASR